MLTVLGANASPYVRKVLIALAEKDLEYTLDPVLPFDISDEFKKLSPLGKIPVLKDGDTVLPDSSVICAYLERKFPKPALYPEDPAAYGRALWFEEYADTAIVAVIGPKIFAQRIINPMFLGKPCDEAVVRSALDEDLPRLFGYLESQLDGGDGIVGGRFSIADVAIASPIVNLQHAKCSIDAQRWPKLARHVAAVHERPSFRKAIETERKFFGG
ncbi:MAG: glutathione S-transferase family protein [Thermodesulfobacteriota bacterium]